MRHLTRGVVAVIFAALAAMLVPSAASAADNGCTDTKSYAPSKGCSVSVVLDPVCTEDLDGALSYVVTTVGVTSSTFTATMSNGTSTVTSAGLPASGTLAWPAGWTGSAIVTFVPDSAPSLSVSSTHAAPVCVSEVLAAGPSTKTTKTSTVSAVLAATGLNASELVALAVGLLVVGTGAVVLVSRRRHARG